MKAAGSGNGREKAQTAQNLISGTGAVDAEVKRLCDLIRETGFALHRHLRSGHLEKVYENGLMHRLTKHGLHVSAQHPLKVYDEDGTVLGDYYADLFVENFLVVEIKACKSIAEEHVAQLLGYMRASGMEHGLLMNFGAAKFEVRKYILTRGDGAARVD